MAIAFPRVCFGQWLCPSLLLWGMWTWRQGCILHTLSFWFAPNRGTFEPYCQNSSFLTTNLWLRYPGGWETLWLPEPKAWTVCSNLPASPFSGSSSRMEKSPYWRPMPLPVCSLPSGSVKPPRKRMEYSHVKGVLFCQERCQLWKKTQSGTIPHGATGVLDAKARSPLCRPFAST